MPEERTLSRLFEGVLPFPETGRVFLVHPPDFLLRRAGESLGAERLWVSERMLERVESMSSRHGDCTIVHESGPSPSSGDCLLLPVEKHRLRFQRELRRLSLAIGAEGRLLVYGSKKEGVLPAQELLEKQGRVEVLRHRGGARLLSFRPDPLRDWELPELPDRYRATARGLSLDLAALPGVFSYNELDEATALLLGAADLREGDRVLDLACGNGVVGTFLAREGRAASVSFTDSDALALEATRKTLALNDIDAPVLAADAGDRLPEKSFDLVLCNPPWHRDYSQERAPGERVLAGAWRLLDSKGRLMLVGPGFHDPLPLLEDSFKNIRLVSETPSHRVFSARKRGRKRKSF